MYTFTNPFAATATGMKRSRSADDDEELQQYNASVRAFDGSGAPPDTKRQRNDTLTDFSAFVMNDWNTSPNGFTSPNTRPGVVRAHTLPFRLPSEPSSSPSFTPFSIPASEGSSTATSPASIMSLPLFPDNADVDMNEEDVSIVGSQSPPSPYHTWKRPAKLHPQALEPPSPRNHLNTGRVPTPRFPTFGSHALSPQTHLLGEGLYQPPSSGSLFGHSPNMPLPSPIKEEEMDADMAGSQLSRLSMNGEDSSIPEEEGMDVDRASSQSMQPPGSLLPRRTRQRSGAITAGSTGRKLVNGYLESCEKCRNKTPGHLMHFLPA